MTSIIKVDTIQNKAGSTTLDADKLPDMYSGSAKAWLNYNGSTNTILKSFNISSLTDNGTGQHDGNFTSNMDGISFSAPACSRQGGGAGDKHYTSPDDSSNIRVVIYNSSGSFVDSDNVSVAVHGDLA